MKFSMSLVIALTFFITQKAISADFCDNDTINKYSKAKEPVKNHVTEIAKLGKVLLADNKADCNFIKEKMKDPNFIVIDARGKGSRGNINGAFGIISDHDEASSHQFTEKVFEQRMSKLLKKYNKEDKPIKEYNLMIFCNGPTCYRTSWAACSLKKMGYASSKINLILDGYFGLKKNCL